MRLAPVDRPVPQLGVLSETLDPRIPLPVDVRLLDDALGGAGAGLALGLAAYDAVDPVDLAAGRRIAALATLETSGAVVPVGGFEQRLDAVVAAGADAVVVPSAQEGIARSLLPPSTRVEVIGVRRFSDAVRVLRG